ncbi:MAG: phosphoglycerate kinase [candidate division WOR-3 bacterium]
MPKLSVKALDTLGRRVFVRVDFNCPLNERGEITDDSRIRASVPTIELLLNKGATVVLGSHLGKPKGKPDKKFSLKVVAERLEQLLGKRVYFAPDCVGFEVVRFLKDVPAKGLVLLENLRFHPGEERNSPEFAKALASLVDLYVNDAFGTAHRAHASTVGMARFFSQPAAGLLLEKELYYLSPLLGNPTRPFVVVIGGAKVSDKAGVIRNLLPKVDRLLLGGGVAFNFLLAQGVSIGRSICEPDLLKDISDLKDDPRLVVPVDVVVAKNAGVLEGKNVRVEEIGPEDIGLDIGKETAGIFSEIITGAKTVVWAGPMGMFEKEPFAQGTFAVAEAMARATALGATTIVGGGDTGAAVRRAGLDNRMSHISTGGGATLEFLEGKVLPGVAVLAEAE